MMGLGSVHHRERAGGGGVTDSLTSAKDGW